ncbi:MAG TPA: ester cyclase [Polyangiaceae bacterium]
MSKITKGLVLAAAVAGCSPRLPAAVRDQNDATKGTKMTSSLEDRNKTLVRSLYEDCINTGRLERLGEYVADEYVGVRGERGPSGFAGVIAALRRGIPDIRFTLEDLVAEGDRVAVRWTWRGTHQGPFAGFSPTGKTLENRAIAIYRIEDGKVVRAWLESDRLGFLQQMGAVDPSLGAGPAAPPSAAGAR